MGMDETVEIWTYFLLHEVNFTARNISFNWTYFKFVEEKLQFLAKELHCAPLGLENSDVVMGL